MRAPSPSAYFRQRCEELLLSYPMTTELPFDHPEYIAALPAFYEESAERSRSVRLAGATWRLLCEGDPLLYGSFMHIFVRLKERFRVEICAGRLRHVRLLRRGAPADDLGRRRADGVARNLAEEALTQRLAGTDAAVIMKLGGNFAKAAPRARAPRADRARDLCRARHHGGREDHAVRRKAGR